MNVSAGNGEQVNRGYFSLDNGTRSYLGKLAGC